MRPMYYQADLDHANRLFKVFLVMSILVHAGILFYKKSRSTFMISGLEPNIEQSFQVRLEEAIRPKSQIRPKPIQKVVKKVKKENKKVVTKSEPTQETQQPVTAAPQTKAFESAIRNYVNPHYPRLALRRGITGTVRLTIWVRGNGIIDKVILAESSGHTSLDASALSAAKQWTFKQLSSNNDEIYKLSKTIVYKIN